MFINDVEVVNGQEVIFDESDGFKFVADEGYFFNMPISFRNGIGSWVNYRLNQDGYNSDYTECVVPGDWLKSIGVDYSGRITVETEPKPIEEEDEPIEDIENDYISIYTLTQEQLNKLSKVVYEFRKVDSGGVESGSLDIGYYMPNLYVLPFNIDNSISDVLSKIKLGSVVLDVYSREINNSKVVIDLGVIKVPLKYENVYDFINTECNVYLPYSKKIILDTSYVIGQEIRIEYVINLYTQETTINIYSSITDKIVYSDSIEVGDKIPFVQKVNYELVHKFDYNLQNKISTPYVEVVRKNPYPVKYYSESRFAKIGDEIGYVRIEDVNLESSASLREQEEIKSLLNQGVYIK